MTHDPVDADELAADDVDTSDSRGEIDEVPTPQRVDPQEEALRAVKDQGVDRSDG